MSNMISRGSRYTDEQRHNAAVHFAALGNMKAVAKAIGIPRTTIIGWKQSDWWQETVITARHAKADEHRARYSELVDAAQKVALEKISEASAAQASIIAATATEKLRLHDNLPTEITGKSFDVAALAEEFAQLSRDYDRDNVIAVQPPDRD